MTAKQITMGNIPVLALRVTYVGELGWEFYAPSEYGEQLWDSLWNAGKEFVMVAGGYKAIDTLRLEKGYRYWSGEISPDYTISPEIRYRGIYEVIVYNSKLNLTGSFSTPTFDEWKIDTNHILWEDAFVSLGLSDLRSIQENISVTCNYHNYFFNPGINQVILLKME